MLVTITEATPHPLETISRAAGMSTDKSNKSFKRAETCIRQDHAVSEFADATFRIEGISRNCMSQLTRHRIGVSFCVESQRYVRYDLSGDDWYVVPMGVEDLPELLEVYRADMHLAASTYRELIDNGVPPEDARFVLPGSMKTNLEMKMNVRSLFHFFDLRLDSHAQWEIQFLASKMMDALAAYSDQWARVIEIYTETRK